MDEKYLEQADQITQAARDDAVAAVRRGEAVPTGFDGSHCVDCDEDIPPGRLQLGKFRCIWCQETKERKWKK